MDEQQANQLLHKEKANSLKASLKAEKEAEDTRVTEEHVAHTISSPKISQQGTTTSEDDQNVLGILARNVNKLQITDDSPDKNSPDKLSRVSIDFLVESASLDGVFSDAGNKEKFAETLFRTLSNESANSRSSTGVIAPDIPKASSNVEASSPSSVKSDVVVSKDERENML